MLFKKLVANTDLDKPNRSLGKSTTAPTIREKSKKTESGRIRLILRL